jgi:hypothetical protein
MVAPGDVFEITEGPYAGSDAKHPCQDRNEQPRPTDHRDGDGSYIEEFEDSGAHRLTLKPADQVEAALLPIAPAEEPASTFRHNERQAGFVDFWRFTLRSNQQSYYF